MTKKHGNHKLEHKIVNTISQQEMTSRELVEVVYGKYEPVLHSSLMNSLKRLYKRNVVTRERVPYAGVNDQTAYVWSLRE